MLIKTLLIIALQFVNLTLGLNILMSSKDSWVSKNTRHLYAGLKAEGHDVRLIAPLNNNGHLNDASIANEKSTSSKREQDGQDGQREILNGGDFGHLLPVHQKYYKTIKQLNNLPRGAKNVILKKDLTNMEEKTNLVYNNYFGQDPLDKSVWYVNASPLESLLIAFDILLPQFEPDFKPDLVLLGPDEGLSLTSSTASQQPLFQENHPNSDNGLDSMMRLAMLKKYPVIGVSTGDDHHIYFQDENFFNIQQGVLSKHLLKKNIFTKNIKFINSRVIELINKLKASNEAMLPENVALNVNFPSINHDVSHCTTSWKDKNNNNPTFKQVVYDKKYDHSKHNILPKYELVNDTIRVVGEYSVTADEDVEQQTFVDKKSYYYSHILRRDTSTDATTDTELNSIETSGNPSQDYSDNDDINQIMSNIDELNVLKNCGISVSVNHLIKGNGLDKDFFDLESLFN